MKKSILTLVLIVCTASSFAGSMEQGISIIPEPVSIVKNEGHYLLPDVVTIASPSGPEMTFLHSLLLEKLSLAPGKKVEFKVNASNADIELLLNESADTTIGAEGYRLNVTPQKITIRANMPAGLLYGSRRCFS